MRQPHVWVIPLIVGAALLVGTPGTTASTSTYPNDPMLGEQWGWFRVNADDVWLAGYRGEVVVAIFDTGIDLNHPDLKNRLWTNPGEIPGNGLDDDGNGFIDDIHGWDFVDDDSDVSDTDGHGTHVAGIIAATANNNAGVAGVAPGAKLMVLRVLETRGGT